MKQFVTHSIVVIALLAPFLSCASSTASTTSSAHLSPATKEYQHQRHAHRRQHSTSKEATLTALREKSDQYFDRGNYPGAIAVDLRIIKLDPSDTEAYNTAAWLAWSLAVSKKLEGVQAEETSNYAKAKFCYIKAENYYAQAESLYRKNIKYNPTKSDAYYDFGMYYVHTKHNYPKAVAVFSQDINYCPDAGVNDWKSLAYAQQMNEQWAACLTTWEIIAQRFPSDVVQKNLQRVQAYCQAHGIASDNSNTTGQR